jgi:hypothetical protein
MPALSADVYASSHALYAATLKLATWRAGIPLEWYVAMLEGAPAGYSLLPAGRNEAELKMESGAEFNHHQAVSGASSGVATTSHQSFDSTSSACGQSGLQMFRYTPTPDDREPCPYHSDVGLVTVRIVSAVSFDSTLSSSGYSSVLWRARPAAVGLER